MRSKKILLGVAFVSMVTLSVSGQIVQREVSYTTSTCKTFRLKCDITADSLSPLDFVHLWAKPALIRHSQFVISDNWLAITYRYPQKPRYERDYEFRMGKSVTDKWGTRLSTQKMVEAVF